MINLDYKLLSAFNAVIEQQSFELAAKKMFISQPAISQRIKTLEENLGQPVLIRSHPITVTPVGEKLLSHYKMVHQLESDLMPNILANAPGKPIKISLAVNADSIATWFLDAISPILKTHLVELNLLIASGTDTIGKLRSGEAIAGLTSVANPLPGYKTERLGTMNYILVASKEFQYRYFNKGVTKSSLKMAPSITYDHKDNMHDQFISKHFDVNANEYYSHRVSSSEAFVDLAKRGLAYCLIPELQIKDELESGELINIYPQAGLIEPLYWHSWVLVKGINKKISQEIVRYGQDILD